MRKSMPMIFIGKELRRTKPMKPLSQTRQALVEEFEKEYVFQHPGDSGAGGHYPTEPVWEVQIEDRKDLENGLNKLLNDYTEEIVRMVEGMRLETHASEQMRRQLWGYNQALNDIKEELNK